jgi:hypothetical protein
MKTGHAVRQRGRPRLDFVWYATSFTFRVAYNELKHDGNALVPLVRATGG